MYFIDKSESPLETSLAISILSMLTSVLPKEDAARNGGIPTQTCFSCEVGCSTVLLLYF